MLAVCLVLYYRSPWKKTVLVCLLQNKRYPVGKIKFKKKKKSDYALISRFGRLAAVNAMSLSVGWSKQNWEKYFFHYLPSTNLKLPPGSLQPTYRTNRIDKPSIVRDDFVCFPFEQRWPVLNIGWTLWQLRLKLKEDGQISKASQNVWKSEKN